MGIFDFLSPNTTAATDAATATAQANLSSTGATDDQTLRNQAHKAIDALQTGAAGATSAINTGYGNATGALASYGGQAQGQIASGVKDAVGTVEGSNAAYQPYVASGGAASGMLSNALGLNGAAGNAAATSAFQASPGYAYQLDQSTDAAARKAASLGLAASGNTLDAITRLGSNLANQDYSQWLSNLQGVGSQGLTAAAGVSGNNQAAGGYQYGGGSTGAQLTESTGQNIGALDAAQGTALGNIQSNLGTGIAGIHTGLGSGIVANDLGIAQDNANLGIADANAQDSAASQNNGILAKALGSFLSPVTSALSSKIGGTLSSATGGWL